MPTRRAVLKGTALSLIGSALPISVIAKQALSVPIKVVYENGIAESVAFKEALKHRASGIYALKQDPAETFRELFGPDHTEMMILGCTKGAAAFVLGELARGQGGKMLIYGEHRYPDYLVTWGFTYNLFKQITRQPAPPLSQVP